MPTESEPFRSEGGVDDNGGVDDMILWFLFRGSCFAMLPSYDMLAMLIGTIKAHPISTYSIFLFFGGSGSLKHAACLLACLIAEEAGRRKKKKRINRTGPAFESAAGKETNDGPLSVLSPPKPDPEDKTRERRSKSKNWKAPQHPGMLLIFSFAASATSPSPSPSPHRQSRPHTSH